jgi:uncharacterized membrane protein
MEAVDGVVWRWILFAGAHIGLGTRRVRRGLVAQLGEQGFGVAFSVVAALTFTPLVRFYAAHRFEGPAGIAAATHPVWHGLLTVLALGGVALAVAGVVAFRPSTMSPFGARVPAVRGLDRVTRHPFFVGVAVLAIVHMLLASRLVGTVFFGGLAAFTLLGMRIQDAKLLHQRGAPYADYLAATSAVPFAAVVRGRQTVVASELPWIGFGVGLAAAVFLRWAHEGILAREGLWVIAVVVGGAFSILVRGFRRNRLRAAAR